MTRNNSEVLQEVTQVLVSTSTESFPEDILTQTDCEVDPIPKPDNEPLNLCIRKDNDSEVIDLSNDDDSEIIDLSKGALDLTMKK